MGDAQKGLAFELAMNRLLNLGICFHVYEKLVMFCTHAHRLPLSLHLGRQLLISPDARLTEYDYVGLGISIKPKRLIVRTFFTKARARLTSDLCPTPLISHLSSHVRTEIEPFVIDLGIKTQGFGLSSPICVGQTRPLHRIMQRDVVMRVERIKIASQSPTEEDRLLGYDGDPRPQGIEPNIQNIHTVYQNPTKGQPAIQIGHGIRAYSASRNKATVMDVFPAPVRPTMPIFSPLLLAKDLWV